MFFNHASTIHIISIWLFVIAVLSLLFQNLAQSQVLQHSSHETNFCLAGQDCTTDIMATTAGKLDSSKPVIDAVLAKVHNALKKGSPYPASPSFFIANLITIDSEGYPASRSVVAREIANDLSYLRFQTRANTRKLVHLKGNNKVAVTYVDGRGKGGWVTFRGEVELQNRSDGEVDIHMTVFKLEAMNYNEKLMQDNDGWQPEMLVRNPDASGSMLAGVWLRVPYDQCFQ